VYFIFTFNPSVLYVSGRFSDLYCALSILINHPQPSVGSYPPYVIVASDVIVFYFLHAKKVSKKRINTIGVVLFITNYFI
jgi:hypothetical protein